VESPIGYALLGAQKDAQVVAAAPAGQEEIAILEVS
jgi:transcription elongation GreA/GreB family factor